jgi:tRNA (5-methylaminomethyl-2-thiouridylate)-methyltransferase
MKVLVGLSGGIDSSVTAYLLKQAGHEVEGVTMLIWKKDSPFPAPVSPNSCYSPSEAEDKEYIAEFCRKLDIPYHVLDCSDLYESTVLENFRNEYMNGRTPNPCVWCNAKIKFGALVENAREKGLVFDKFATGHYARITYSEELGRFELRKGKDLKKDQSYFLYRLTQEQLSNTLFPLGDYEKTEIRKIDEREGFHEPGQVESQDFYGGDYSDLLSVKDKKGRIVDTAGRTMGWHNGFWHYTVGQRRGLGIANPFPLYVLRLDPEKNEVVVGGESDTFSHEVFVCNVNYVSRTEFEEGKVYSVKIRSTSPGEAAMAEQTEDGFVLRFLSPVKAATSGQSAVIYDEDLVVAGGLIR